MDLRGESMSDASVMSLTTFANRRDNSLVSSYVAPPFAPPVEDVTALSEELTSEGSGDGVAALLLNFCSRALMLMVTS